MRLVLVAAVVSAGCSIPRTEVRTSYRAPHAADTGTVQVRFEPPVRGGRLLIGDDEQVELDGKVGTVVVHGLAPGSHTLTFEKGGATRASTGTTVAAGRVSQVVLRPSDSTPTSAPKPWIPAHRLVGPFHKDDYPSQIVYRPMTLPRGMVRAALAYRYAPRIEPAPDYRHAELDLTAGITDRWQVSAAGDYQLPPTERAPAHIHLASRYFLYDGVFWDAAVSAHVPVYFTGRHVPTASLSIPIRRLLPISDFFGLKDGLSALYWPSLFADFGNDRLAGTLSAGLLLQLRRRLAWHQTLTVARWRIRGDGPASTTDPYAYSIGLTWTPLDPIDLNLSWGTGGWFASLSLRL